MANTARVGQTNPKWSINIQELVKRTQKNLDRGNSSLTRTFGEQGLPQKLESVTESSCSTTNLYRDLKNKLALEAIGGSNIQNQSNSVKNMLRPSSAQMKHQNLLQKHIGTKKETFYAKATNSVRVARGVTTISPTSTKKTKILRRSWS